jgi:hypothetical protein
MGTSRISPVQQLSKMPPRSHRVQALLKALTDDQDQDRAATAVGQAWLIASTTYVGRPKQSHEFGMCPPPLPTTHLLPLQQHVVLLL